MRIKILQYLTSFLGVTCIITVSAVIGALVLREAKSFSGPGSGPNITGPGGYSLATGVIGNPNDFPSLGVSNLFEGQAKILNEIVTQCP